MGKSMEHRRALFAYRQLVVLEGESGLDKADGIKTAACKAVALILNSGFLQAMDFCGNKLELAYKPLMAWFAESKEGPELSEKIRTAAGSGKSTELNNALAEAGTDMYRLAMEEAVAFLGQIKSKAEGKKNELKHRIDEEKAKAARATGEAEGGRDDSGSKD